LPILWVVLTAWIGWRWFRSIFGVIEVARAPRGAERRHVRRAVIGYTASSVFLTVFAVLLWTAALARQPSADLNGFLAAALMCSLAIGIIVKFMSAAEGVDDRHDGGSDHDDDQRREDAEQ
jgi:hypothetical protein